MSTILRRNYLVMGLVSLLLALATTSLVAWALDRSPPTRLANNDSDLSLGESVSLPPQLVTADAPFSYTFTVANPFREVVAFDKVRTSCSCTAYVLDEYTLEPGGRTQLTVKVGTSTKQLGLKSITAVLTDSKERKWPYRLSAITYPILRLENDAVFLALDENARTTPWEKSFKAYVYQGGDELPPALAVEDDGSVAACVKAVGKRVLPSGVVESEYCVTVRSSGPQRAGTGAAKLTFHADNRTAKCDRTCEIHWNIPNAFDVNPPAISFGYMPSADVERSVVIKRRDGMPFRMLESKLDLASVSVVIEPRDCAASEVKITARLNQSDVDGSFYRLLELKSDDPANPDLGIWVSGIQRSNSAH